MKRFGLMLVGVAGLAWGYGDLPSTFDATTGYVTLTARDNTGAANQSFFLPGHWSDNQAPHADTNYYVKAGWCLGTPHQDSDVTAQQTVDPDGYLTFQGGTLVVAGYIWHLNGTYEFTFPDLRLLPGGDIRYTATKPPLNGMMTVYGTCDNPSFVNFSNISGTKTMALGMTIKGDAESCLATTWNKSSCWLRLTGDLSEFYGTLYVGSGTNQADNSVGFWIDSDCIGGTVELPITQASLYMASANGLTAGGLKVTSASTKLFLDGTQVNATVPRLTVTNSLTMTRPVNVMLNHATVGNGAPSFSNPSEPEVPGEYPLIRLTPEVIRNGGWTAGRLANLFVLSTSPALKRSELMWQDDEDGGKTLWLITCVMHAGMSDKQGRSSLLYTVKTVGGSDYYWSNESCPADDPASGGTCYFSTNLVYAPRDSDLPSGNVPYRFPGKMLVSGGNQGIYSFNSSGFICDRLVWHGAGFNMSSATSDEPERYDEKGTRYKFCTLQGKLYVPSGYGANVIQSYGKVNVVRVESEVIGAADFTVRTINNAGNYANDRGSVEFAACNTNFTGKVKVSTSNHTYSDSGVVVPNWEQRVRLLVSDERNLGGARDEFAWDALLIEQYSDLFPLNDVTFTDGWNRGIAIGNIGRMHVTNGLTLAIWRPLNVNGNLVKEGGGTLALGGPLTSAVRRRARRPRPARTCSPRWAALSSRSRRTPLTASRSRSPTTPR